MIALTAAEIAAVTGGRLIGLTDGQADSVLVDGPVVSDSRECGPGGLYVARVGESRDGHDFIEAARSAGAVLALTSREVAGPAVVVPDVQDGFAAVARAVVDRGSALVIGITGSSGKTTVKDLLAGVLADLGPTISPVGSLNSEVGVPLTVCRMGPETRYLVVEMGARGIGHIRYLTEIAPPRIGVVLNVGVAHVGEFGSPAAIAIAKAELVEALPADGVAILNADDPAVRAMSARTRARVVFVGESDDADVRATDVVVGPDGRASFDVVTSDARAQVALRLVGRHQVGNALAVAAMAREAGMSLDRIAVLLSQLGPVSRWRMEVTLRPDGVTVVNDAYNANPDSMRAALESLASMATSGRRVAVLGSMLELGDLSDAAHRETGGLAVSLGVDHVVAVGAGAAGIAAGATEALSSGEGGAGTVHTAADTDTAYDLLGRLLQPGDVVLFKSSRDAGLRFLADRCALPDEGTDVTPARRGEAS